MKAGSHVVLGAAAWAIAAPHLGFGVNGAAGVYVAGFTLAAAGGLLPDIDHPQSWVGRRTRPVSTAIASAFGHRGVTHSVLAVAACAWVLLRGGAPRWVADAIAVGYASHLAGDLLTPRGLRLAWPLRGTWALPVCKTGSPAEPLIVAAVILWAVMGIGGPVHLWQAVHNLASQATCLTEAACHRHTGSAQGRVM